MVRKAVKRVLVTLAVLIVAYPLSAYPAARLEAHEVLPEKLNQITDSIYAPLGWYIDSGLPGSREFSKSILWFASIGK
jgi:hypothetical protein